MTNVIELTQELKELIEELNDKEREADSAIKGFFYQIDVTLERVLNDTESKKFCIEKIEDILELGDMVNGGDCINIIQVKNHERETTNSIYYKPITYFYLSFLKIREKNLHDKFRFILIKYDESGIKDVKAIINEAINISTNQKLNSLRVKIKDLENKINIGQDNLFAEFSNLVSFIHMDEYSRLIKRNIEKLKEIKGCTFEDAEKYYGFLWIYIKKTFFDENRKDSMTRKELLEYLRNSIEEMGEVLLDENWKIITDNVININKRLIDIELVVTASHEDVKSIKEEVKFINDSIKISKTETDSQSTGLLNLVCKCIAKIKDIIISYELQEVVYDVLTIEDIFCGEILDEIGKFIKENINSDHDAKYFIVSIYPQYYNNGDAENISCNDILQAYTIVESYIIRLSQVYYFKRYIDKDIGSLNELIYIDNKKIWHIKFNHKDKGEVFINLLGGNGRDPHNRCSELSSILRKYDHFYRDKYPDLLLYSNKNKRGYVSKLEISKYKDTMSQAQLNRTKMNIAKINRDIFIKCLGCMEEENFEEYTNISNLFEFECRGV